MGAMIAGTTLGVVVFERVRRELGESRWYENFKVGPKMGDAEGRHGPRC